jgi:hypothetical protein
MCPFLGCSSNASNPLCLDRAHSDGSTSLVCKFHSDFGGP